MGCRAHMKHVLDTNLWPLCYPDLNPIDYFVQSWVEKDVNRTPYNTIQSLISENTRVFNDMPHDKVSIGCSSFKKCMEYVVAAKFGLISKYVRYD